MLDMIVRGGRVVTPQRVAEMDVAVQGEKIVAVAEPGVLGVEAARVLDASGKIVVPGGVEPHAHVATPVPQIWTGQKGVETQSPEAASRAAAFGGTTTMVDFARPLHGATPLEAVEQRVRRFSGHSYIDFAFHSVFNGASPPEHVAQIRELISSGVASIKVWTITRPGDPPNPATDDGHLWAVMDQAGRHGGIVAVHGEDPAIVDYMTEKLKREGRDQAYNIHLAHNNLSEELTFRKTVRIARATGAAVYFVHVTAREGVEAIVGARSDGLPIYGEVLHHFLCFTSEDYRRPEGNLYHTNPGLKFPEDREALWRGTITGAISTVATDEFTTHKASKLSGKTIETIQGGHNGIETRFIIAYSEGVAKGRISLQRFVEITSSNPARLMGMYPTKGAIAAGSDADIVLIDPDVRKAIALSDLHADSDYSIWEGWQVQGWPVTTILRGSVVVEDGKLVGSPLRGQFVKRKIASDVLSHPAC
jgi:dihydropyrimidinase